MAQERKQDPNAGNAPDRRSNDIRDRNDWSTLGPGNPYNFGYGYGRGRKGYYGEGDYTQGRGDWDVTGPYSGRGPRNFETSDERISDQVCERLYLHGYIDASDIEVDVNNGEVTLTGTVTDRWTKRAAEDTAETVPGVADIHNRLTIQRRDGAV